MKRGDRVSTEQGQGKLWQYDEIDGEWLVEINNGLLSYPESEIRSTEPLKPRARIEDWNHLYKVGQALEFINQLGSRGDEAGVEMYDTLKPLVDEIKNLREKENDD